MRNIILGLLLLNISSGFALDLNEIEYVGGPEHRVSFKEGYMIYEDLQEEKFSFEGSFQVTQTGKFNILECSLYKFLVLQSEYSISLLSLTEGMHDITGALILSNGNFSYEGDLLILSKCRRDSCRIR